MRVAIMQPYIFPYLGYFQLINLVDTFVFFDDVNFRKKSFINRNNILLNNRVYQFTIPCKTISQNTLIKDTYLNFDVKARIKLLKTITAAYSKALYYNDVYPLIQEVLLNDENHTISTLAINSCKTVSDYLEISTKYKLSSVDYEDTKHLLKEDRLISISKKHNARDYINLIGGQDLYDKSYFEKKGVNLHFIKSKDIMYKQFNQKLIPNLSIIDVLMFNSKKETKDLLMSYDLI